MAMVYSIKPNACHIKKTKLINLNAAIQCAAKVNCYCLSNRLEFFAENFRRLLSVHTCSAYTGQAAFVACTAAKLQTFATQLRDFAYSRT